MLVRQPSPGAHTPEAGGIGNLVVTEQTQYDKKGDIESIFKQIKAQKGSD